MKIQVYPHIKYNIRFRIIVAAIMKKHKTKSNLNICIVYVGEYLTR